MRESRVGYVGGVEREHRTVFGDAGADDAQRTLQHHELIQRTARREGHRKGCTARRHSCALHGSRPL